MMKSRIQLIIQVLFGLIILLAGINKLYLFIQVPEQTPEGKQFIDFLYATGYLMYLVALVEILGGALLVINRYVLLALLLLAPVTCNILLFHLFLEQKGLPMGILVFVLQLILMVWHKKSFLPLIEEGSPMLNAVAEEELEGTLNK